MVRKYIVITSYRESRAARTRAATGNWYICTATSRKPSDSLDRSGRTPLLMNFRIRAVNDLLEPCEAKVSRTVLRGGGGSNTSSLPGQRKGGVPVLLQGFHPWLLTDAPSGRRPSGAVLSP